ncbi:unnamed protein product [Mytilus coruscus]|uniref:EGF-like domain-containing protein n=1 Tax=Mytilus coruscus TaxID=42192 RepID=A0A6J8BN88_MYTCO|nr:unnamed protein product [Mytilus coruscus]
MMIVFFIYIAAGVEGPLSSVRWHDDSVFFIYIAAGVEGAVYGGNCTGNGDCTEANNVCTSTKCACSPTSYKKDSTTKCVTKIALAGTCTTSPTGQCAATNAECHATHLKCECMSSYFANKNGACASQVTALDRTCDGKDSATDQCSVANTECTVDGAGSKCLCKTTHYKKGGACEIRKKPDEEGCAASQCVTHATCNTKSSPTKCECDAGYTATPTATPTMYMMERCDQATGNKGFDYPHARLSKCIPATVNKLKMLISMGDHTKGTSDGPAMYDLEIYYIVMNPSTLLHRRGQPEGQRGIATCTTKLTLCLDMYWTVIFFVVVIFC